MAFAWGAAARGAGDALEKLLAERYAKTQEAERVAREIAREQRAAEQWTQSMQFNREAAARSAEQFKAQQEQQKLMNERQAKADTRAESQFQNQFGTRQMIGDWATQRRAAGSPPISPTELGTIEAMAITEGIELPKSMTEKPERRLINTLGPRGELVPRALTDEDIEAGATAGTLRGYVAPREPRQGAQPNMVTLYRAKPGGGVENVDVTEGPEANKMYAQGWTKTAPKDVAASDEAKDTAAEVQRLSGELARHKGFPGTFGKWSSQNPKFTSSQDTIDARRMLSSLTGLLTLENMNKMKGVLSDSDMQILRSASSILAEELSEPAARTELNRLGKVMAKLSGQPWLDLDTGTTEIGRAPAPGPSTEPVNWTRDANGNPVLRKP